MIFSFIKKIPFVRRAFDLPAFAKLQPEDLPRTIYMYWDTGFDAAPDLCRRCVDSWKMHNPDWEVVLLDAQSAAEIVDPNSVCPSIGKAHYADLVRMQLLQDRGGVWADATTLCLRPLNDWLVPMFGQTDMFVFSRPGPDRMVSNWFIASIAGNFRIRKWCDASMRLWKARKKPPFNYFWQHALYQSLVLRSAPFRADHRTMPAIAADLCHDLQYAHKEGHLGKATLQRIKYTPLQKLTYKSGMTVSDIELTLQALNSAEPAEVKFT